MICIRFDESGFLGLIPRFANMLALHTLTATATASGILIVVLIDLAVPPHGRRSVSGRDLARAPLTAGL